MDKNIRDYGALGDGVHDDSAAIQAAVDSCAPGDSVLFPSGIFPCADIHMRPHIALTGTATWGYREARNTGCLIPSRDSARCLIDITDAFGCTLRGLTLSGGNRGEEMHGVLISRSDWTEEDSIRVENCRIEGFSGDALRLERVWCLTVSGNMLSGSRNGIYLQGWDLFIYDNWLTANRQCGFYGVPGCNAAVMFRGNRVEWNRQEGILSDGGVTWMVNDNHFDRNGFSGASFLGVKHLTMVGNIFARDGWRVGENEHGAGLTVKNGCGINIQSNSFRSYWGDGKKKERHSPDFDFLIEKLDTAVIQGNVMYQAALVENIRDLGGHVNTVIRDNPASLAGDNC